MLILNACIFTNINTIKGRKSLVSYKVVISYLKKIIDFNPTWIIILPAHKGTSCWVMYDKLQTIYKDLILHVVLKHC